MKELAELSIDERCVALGLTVKPKRAFNIDNYDVTVKADRVKLRGIVRNKKCLDNTRKLCLDVLEAYEVAKKSAKSKV